MDAKHIDLLNEDLGKLKLLLTPLITENITVRNDNIRCLNLACGRADESGVLKEILAPLASSLQIFGVDIRSRELDIAQNRWRSDPHTSYDFIFHDATKLHLITELDQQCHIILMRHQNYWNGANTWQKIYASALDRLSPDGILVITSYFDQEHLQAIQAIQQLDANLIITIQNTQSRLIQEPPKKSVDRHIALFSKSSNII